MDIELTAPYSPSQNRVAEHMNRTLVELARAMLQASDLPEFLWEPAVAHAVYIRNRAYTSAIKDQTPYQGWYGNKPNVTHLREFGAPIWILLQGQTKGRKIMPKSQPRAYVGNEDTSKSVLYYNAQTKRILTLCNYVFLNVKQQDPPEDIIITQTPFARRGVRRNRRARGTVSTKA